MRNARAATIRPAQYWQNVPAFLLACYPACYPAHIPPTPQCSQGSRLDDTQPTRKQSANACSRSANATMQNDAPPVSVDDPRNQRRQRFDCETPPLHLTHSPTIRRRKARRNAVRQFRHPVPYQPPQFAPTGQRFPASPAGYLRTIPARYAGIPARSLA